MIDPKALVKAESRLRVARSTLSELAECKSFDEFRDKWYVYLTVSKNIYTSLEQGSKTTPQDMQWFGAKKAERRADPLLQYLFQARDDDEHGLENVLAHTPSQLKIGVSKEGFSESIRIDGMYGPGGTLRVTSLDGKPVKIEHDPEKITLSPVTGRGHIIYQPPTHHKGVLIEDPSPLAVAALALTHLECLVSEAKERA